MLRPDHTGCWCTQCTLILTRGIATEDIFSRFRVHARQFCINRSPWLEVRHSDYCSRRYQLTTTMNTTFALFLTAALFGTFVFLLDFSLTVKAATLTFISGRGSAISFAKEGKLGFIYNLIKS